MCHAKRLILGETVGCVVMSPPSLWMAAYGTGFSIVTSPNPGLLCMELIRWFLLEVSGPYLASGPPCFCLRVFFQGCSPSSSQPPSRKFCLKWFTAITPTLRGRRSFTSFIMSSLAFSTSFSKFFASIGKVFCYFYLHFKEMLYLCSIPIRSYRLSRLEVWGFFIFPSMNKIAHSLFYIEPF